MSKLDNPQLRKDIAKEILRRIDEYCVKIYDDGHRSHLGASIIGKTCQREIWYSFRWVYHKVFDGRMYRLFNRGHREEQKLLEYLRGIGFKIVDIVDGKQQIFIAVDGHYGGGLDGTGFFPEDFQIDQKVLVEFKTKKTGSDFNNLKKHGVRHENYQHFVQMSTYGKYYGIQYCIYFTVNKNDDDIYIEIVPLDHSIAEDKTLVADKIIHSRQAPNRIASSPAFSACKMCDFSPICWEGIQPEKNCRSCSMATPVENAQWFCEHYKMIIPKEFISKGCDNWDAVK